MKEQKVPVGARSPRSPQNTRDLVLRAAIDEFGEHGLAGGRVDRIAKRAGVNKQALYYHYGDKEALFTAALVFGYTQFKLPAIDPGDDRRSATDLMAHVIGAMFDLVNANRNHIALISDENRNRGQHLTPEVRDHVRRATAPTIAVIRTILDRGQQTGEFGAWIDSDDLYLMLVGYPIFYFNHAYTVSGVFDDDVLAPAAIAHRRTGFVNFMLAALGAQVQPHTARSTRSRG